MNSGRGTSDADGGSAAFRRMADDFRQATGKAESAELQAALAVAALKSERYADTVDAYAEKQKAGTDTVDDQLHRIDVFQENLAAFREVLTLCEQAGWKS